MNLTRHAEARRVEFGLWWEDVAQILDDPEIIGPLERPEARYREGSRVYRRGKWSIVVDGDGETVITILPVRTDDWEHA